MVWIVEVPENILLHDVPGWIFKKLKIAITYLFFLLAAFSFGQAPFQRVRTDLNNYNSIALLDSCSNKNYYNDSVLFYRTLINLKKGEYRMAEKNCRKLAKLYPHFSEVHYLRGMLLCSNQHYGKSVTEFNLAIEANPLNVKAFYNRSVAFGLMEEYLSAIEDLGTCIKLNPDYTLAYYSRAYWYEFTGNYVESARDYEKTIRLDPKNYDAYLGVAYTYQNLGEPAKACEALNEAIKEGSQVAEEIKGIFCK